MRHKLVPGARILFVTLAFTVHLGAQERSARLRGRVIDRSSALGIARAEIALMGEGRSVQSDSGGNFTLRDLPTGVLQIFVRAMGFEPTQLYLDVKGGGELERTIVLDSSNLARRAQALPAVTIKEASPSDYRLADFERRRRTGRGHYLTDEEIRASGANTLQAAVRGLRGVNFECRADGMCRIHMARAPNNCDPDYVIDARVDNMFGPTTPIRDIVALEVYTGPSDVPGEFAGRDAGCGVIVIWTRSGPTPRRP